MNKQAIILFDGVCNLCNSSVQFIIENDTKNKFRFASLQSEFGQNVLKENNMSLTEFDSIILLKDNKILKASEAAIEIFKELKGFKWTVFFWFVPHSLRDFLYAIIAKNRYKIFGKTESCWLPTPALKQKFISDTNV